MSVSYTTKRKDITWDEQRKSLYSETNALQEKNSEESEQKRVSKSKVRLTWIGSSSISLFLTCYVI